MRGEEPSGFVDQELVQVRCGMLGRATKSGRGVRNDLRQRVAPYAAAHRDLRRVDLPAGANRAVYQRLHASAVGRPLRHRGQGLSLRRRDGKRKHACPADLHARHRHEQSALRAVVSRAFDRLQQRLQRRLRIGVRNLHVPHPGSRRDAESLIMARRPSSPGS